MVVALEVAVDLISITGTTGCGSATDNPGDMGSIRMSGRGFGGKYGRGSRGKSHGPKGWPKKALGKAVGAGGEKGGTSGTSPSCT